MMARMAMTVIVRAGFLGILFIFTGCGGDPKTVPATGQVLLPDGAPVTSGQVEFRSSDATVPAAMGAIGKDGRFRLATAGQTDGAVPGEYRAVVIPAIPDESSASAAAATIRIDPKFMDYKTSGLKFSVTEDPEKNHFQIYVGRAPGK
jgi:hypothetical protein